MASIIRFPRAAILAAACCAAAAHAGTIIITYTGTAVGFDNVANANYSRPFSLVFIADTGGRHEYGSDPDGSYGHAIYDSTSAVLRVGADTYLFPTGPGSTSYVTGALNMPNIYTGGNAASRASQSVDFLFDDGTSNTTGLVFSELFGANDDLYAFADLYHQQSLTFINTDANGQLEYPRVYCGNGAGCLSGDAQFEYLQKRDTDGFVLQSSSANLYARTATFLVTGSVPEPASWALFVAGFGLVGGALRARGVPRAA